jgi:two-component system phosphate regulon response regulator PhoB
VDAVVSGRVLLVDGDAGTRAVLADAFAREWIAAEWVATAEEAVVTLETADPDVVVIDADLPGMTGIALLHRLRTDPRRGRLSLVLIAARAHELDRSVALELGADDVVDRPLSVRELVLRVRALLRRRTT